MLSCFTLLFKTIFIIFYQKVTGFFQGQCFIAVDPNAFAPGFPDRLNDLMDTCRNLEPVSSS